MKREWEEWSLAAAASLQLWSGKSRERIVYTDRCEGILEVSGEYLRFKLGREICTVWGSGLRVMCYEDGKLLLAGEVARIEME